MTELNKLTTEELIKEYNLTNNEDILQEIFDRTKGIIANKIKTYYLFYHKELAYSCVYEEIWKAVKTYDSNKNNSAYYYLVMIIERTLKTLLTKLNRGKNKINRDASSMNNTIANSEGIIQEYHDFIGDKNLNPEVITLDKLETKRKINKLINQLSKLEYKVFKAYIKTFNPTENAQANHEEIMKLTKVHKKGIDNALQRIKLKASKIS